MSNEELIKALRGVQYVVINTCYGGFGLSERAVRVYKDMAGITDDKWYDRDIPRDDPYLIKIVRDLGMTANGSHANLKIVEVPPDVEWQIEEYDGNEWVAEKTQDLAVSITLPSIGEVLATRARAVFPYRINFDKVGYENLSLMKSWCEDNCKSIWRSESTHALYWQFEDDYDATMFMLRWGSAEGNELK